MEVAARVVAELPERSRVRRYHHLVELPGRSPVRRRRRMVA